MTLAAETELAEMREMVEELLKASLLWLRSERLSCISSDKERLCWSRTCVTLVEVMSEESLAVPFLVAPTLSPGKEQQHPMNE